MTSQSIQVSIPRELLREIDGRAETKRVGRSAIIRRALELYLQQVKNQEIDRAYDRAYAGRAEAVDDDFRPLMKRQSWPPK